MSLITDSYLKLNLALHESEPTYGTSSWQYAPAVRGLCKLYGTRDILDYGCGKGRLQEELGFPIQQYDPAILQFNDQPVPADIVVCGDVMEHIEPECIDEVIEHITALTQVATYWVIATRLAAKTLGDGRNCHLTVKPAEWWVSKILDAGNSLAMGATKFGRKGEAIFTTTPR